MSWRGIADLVRQMLPAAQSVPASLSVREAAAWTAAATLGMAKVTELPELVNFGALTLQVCE